MNKVIRPIARIKTDFPDKFGVPRQSGLAPELRGEIVFEPEYRRIEAVRGLEGFSHVWLVWGFSLTDNEQFRPTVRPPRLGGNERVGVFATRSPYRPNGLGLSSVRLISIDYGRRDAPVLIVGGADLADGTPIYDIKPYLPAFDSHPDANGSFSDEYAGYSLKVNDERRALSAIPEEKRAALYGVLSSDPRPSYQSDPERIYGMRYAGYEIKFRVADGILYVLSAEADGQISNETSSFRSQ